MNTKRLTLYKLYKLKSIINNMKTAAQVNFIVEPIRHLTIRNHSNVCFGLYACMEVFLLTVKVVVLCVQIVLLTLVHFYFRYNTSHTKNRTNYLVKSTYVELHRGYSFIFVVEFEYIVIALSSLWGCIRSLDNIVVLVWYKVVLLVWGVQAWILVHPTWLPQEQTYRYHLYLEIMFQ